MSKLREELIESMQQAAAPRWWPQGIGHACDYSEDSRRESDQESITYVATPLRRIVSNSTSDAKKLRTRKARTRRTRGGLFAGDSTPAEGSHGRTPQCAHGAVARMRARASSLVVCGPLASAAAQIAQGSPRLNRRYEFT